MGVFGCDQGGLFFFGEGHDGIGRVNTRMATAIEALLKILRSESVQRLKFFGMSKENVAEARLFFVRSGRGGMVPLRPNHGKHFSIRSTQLF